jgi:uncharacterized repeat protein (TIGR01451 family)
MPPLLRARCAPARRSNLFGRDAIMAGKLRVAAKLFLGTTVLASVGGGAYYYTTHGLQLPSFLQTHKPPARADLDAVASAWAELPKAHVADPSLSSPIARSAKPESSLPGKHADKAPTDDRYATVVEEPAKEKAESDITTSEIPSTDDSVAKEKSSAEAPLAVAKIDEPVSDKATTDTELEPTPAVDAEPVALASHTETTNDNDTTNEAAPAPTVAVPTPAETAVARGQEPKDEPPVKLNNSPAELEATLNAAGASKPLSEPKPLSLPAQPTNIGASSTRAKEAFGNPPPSTSNDRYGNSAPMAREALAPPTNGAVVNPFSTKPAGAAPAPPKNDTIQPLPSNAEGLDDGFGDQAPGRNDLQPLQGPSTANSMNRELPAKRSLGLPSPRERLGNPDSRPLPPDNSLPPNNLIRNSDEPVTPIPVGDGAGKPGEKALEGPQQPTLVIQKFAPGEIQVGKPAKFVVQVRNAGAQSADDVTVRDEIPQGTKLVSTSPNAATEGGAIVWKLGKLSPGEDRTVEMQLMPTTEGEIGSVATVQYSAQASVKTKCTMPQLAVRMTAANEVMIGNQQHVKIEIKNPGTGDATHVMLFENVPQNVKHAAGPALEFEIGTLRPGETRELDLVLTAEKAGKVVNALTARADGNLQVQQQVEFEVIAPALAIDVEGPERRYLERPATYEVSVVNPGTAPAHNVQIVTKLPKGMKFVRANNMGEYDAATHAVYWSLAELPKGERGSVEVVAMPTETGQQTLHVEGHAQQGLTDHKQRDIVVEGLAAIMFEVRDLEDPIEVGGETGYEIRVVNQGTKAATNVQVSCDIPAGMKVVSAEGESAHKIQDGRLVFEPLEQLAPKADTLYRVRAQGLQPGDQRITVQVNTDDLEQPIRREESTQVFGDQ